MAINSDLAFVMFKKEASPGTAEAIGDLNYSVAVSRESIEFDHGIQFNEGVGNVATGQHGNKESTVGQYQSTFSFSMPYKIPSSLDSAPAFANLLEACGLKGAAQSTTGYSFVPSKDNDEATVTIAIGYPTDSSNMDYYLFKGCHGTPIISTEDTGAPIMWQLSFNGVYSSSGTTSTTDLSGEDTNLSLTWANGSFYKDTFSNIDAGSASNLKVHNFSLEFGITLVPVKSNADAGGISHYMGGAHNPTLTVVREALEYSTEDVVDDVISETVTTIELSSGDLRCRIPDAQNLNPSFTNQDGLLVWEESYKCLLNGDDSSNLTDSDLDFENYIEIINGTRS